MRGKAVLAVAVVGAGFLVNHLLWLLDPMGRLG